MRRFAEMFRRFIAVKRGLPAFYRGECVCLLKLLRRIDIGRGGEYISVRV